MSHCAIPCVNKVVVQSRHRCGVCVLHSHERDRVRVLLPDAQQHAPWPGARPRNVCAARMHSVRHRLCHGCTARWIFTNFWRHRPKTATAEEVPQLLTPPPRSRLHPPPIPANRSAMTSSTASTTRRRPLPQQHVCIPSRRMTELPLASTASMGIGVTSSRSFGRTSQIPASVRARRARMDPLAAPLLRQIAGTPLRPERRRLLLHPAHLRVRGGLAPAGGG
jgi:hypothetical protein